jgi:hypothetical protein
MGRVFQRRSWIPALVVLVVPILFASVAVAKDKDEIPATPAPDTSFLSDLMSMLGGFSAEMEAHSSPYLPPGQGGTPPGQGGLPPGLGGVAPPGLGGTPPGQGGTPPGQEKKDEGTEEPAPADE